MFYVDKSELCLIAGPPVLTIKSVDNFILQNYARYTAHEL